jgi:hypothetical protein
MNNFFRVIGIGCLIEGVRVFYEQENVIGPSTVLLVIGLCFILLTIK